MCILYISTAQMEFIQHSKNQTFASVKMHGFLTVKKYNQPDDVSELKLK